MEQSSRQVQHFGFRKFSVGLTSVLLSTSLYFGFMGAGAQAATTPLSQTSSESTEQTSSASSSSARSELNKEVLSSSTSSASSSVKSADKTDLQKLYDEIVKSEEKNQLASQLTSVKSILNNESASQTEVDSALASLKQAYIKALSDNAKKQEQANAQASETKVAKQTQETQPVVKDNSLSVTKVANQDNATVAALTTNLAAQASNSNAANTATNNDAGAESEAISTSETAPNGIDQVAKQTAATTVTNANEVVTSSDQTQNRSKREAVTNAEADKSTTGSTIQGRNIKVTFLGGNQFYASSDGDDQPTGAVNPGVDVDQGYYVAAVSFQGKAGDTVKITLPYVKGFSPSKLGAQADLPASVTSQKEETITGEDGRQYLVETYNLTNNIESLVTVYFQYQNQGVWIVSGKDSAKIYNLSASDIGDKTYQIKAVIGSGEDPEKDKDKQESSADFTTHIKENFTFARMSNDSSLVAGSGQDPYPDGTPKVIAGKEFSTFLHVWDNVSLPANNGQANYWGIYGGTNLGTTITIPTPEGYQIDAVGTMNVNGWDSKGYHITQDGPGKDIIIQIDSGYGIMYQDTPQASYRILGRFTQAIPDFDTRVWASGPIHVEKTNSYDSTGKKVTISYTGDSTWNETIMGQDSIDKAKKASQTAIDPDTGMPKEASSIAGNYGSVNSYKVPKRKSEKLFLDAEPDDNEGSFRFDTGTAQSFTTKDGNPTLYFTFDKKLNVYKLSTPNAAFMQGTNFINNYHYTLTRADGSTQTGKIDAGGIIENANPTSAIVSIVLTPDQVSSASIVNHYFDKHNQYTFYGRVVNKNLATGETKSNVGDKLTATFQFRSTTAQGVVINSPIAKLTQTVDETEASLKFEALPDTSVQAGDLQGWTIRGLYDDSSKTASGYSSYEPIIYYVLPKGITYRNAPGLAAGNFTAGGNTAIPKVSTFVNSQGEQVIKVDYTGTKSYYTWPKDKSGINDQYTIGAVPGLDVLAGNYKGSVYIKSTTPMDSTLNPKATSDDAKNLLDLAGDATNLYHVSDLTFKVNSGDIVNTVTSAKVDNGAWSDVVKTDVNPTHFKDHTISFGWTLNNQASDGVKGIVSVAEVPQIDKHGNSMNFQLTGPITLPSNLTNAKAYYYTGDFNMDNTEVSGKPDLSQWQTADQITDWSKVKYVAIAIDSLPPKSSSGRIEITGYITQSRYSNAGTAFLPTITYTKKPDNTDNGPLSILTKTNTDGRRRAAEVDATVMDSLDVKAVFPSDSGIADIDLGRGPVYTPNAGEVYTESDYPDSMADGKIPAGWKLDKKVLVGKDGQEYAWGSSVFYAITGEPYFTDLHVEFRYVHNQRVITPGDFPDKDKSDPVDGITYRDVVKTVTRTIRIHKTDGTIETVTQPVDFYRTITYDEVDKKIIATSAYKPDDSLWAAYNVPSVQDKVIVYTKTIDGKTTDPTIISDGNVPEETIDSNTNDEFVDVYYQNPGTKKPDAQKTVTRTVVVNFPAGYSVDATALKANDGNGVTTTVNGQTVTRTYTTTMTRTVSLKSDGTWQTTDWQYTDRNWPDVTNGSDLLPAITKYTPTVTDNIKKTTVDSINAETVDENTQNESFTIDYVQNGVIQIVAVDKSSNNKPIALGDLTTTMEGKDGSNIDQTTLNGYIDAIKQRLAGQNYKFDSQTPTSNPTTYADQTITLYFTHNTQDFTPDNKPSDAEDLEKTISRTITVNFPDEAHAQAFAGQAGYTVNGKSVTRTDTASFTRTATKDLVTNTYTYSPWVVKGTSQASATLPGLNYGEAFLPEISRYAPNRSSVSSVSVDDAYIKAGTTPESVTISYAPVSSTFQVVLEDQDDGNKVVKAFIFNNKVGETHTYSDTEKSLPANYEWADENNKLGDSITLSDTTPAVTVYYVKHMHKTTTGTKDVTRTVDGTKPDGSAINYSDKVTFNYTTDTDLVNGKTTTKYDHDSQSFNAVADDVAPATINGYTRVLNGGSLDAQTVTPNSSDINVHVSYIANDQKILIKAYDVHNNSKTELAIPRGIMTSIIGKSKAVVDTSEVQAAIDAIKQYLESNGYTMITKDPVIPQNYDSDDKVDQIIELDFDHKTDVVDHDHIPDGSPIKKADLETTVKRTVTVHNTDGSTQTVSQDFIATRTANYDPVTKTVISYNPWSGSSDTYTISPQKGYKSRWTTRFGEGATIAAKSGDSDYQVVPAYDVDAQHITADTVPGENVDVYYDAQDATRTIKYQDKDTGKIVGSFDSDPAKVGTQVDVDIKGHVPDGYELTPNIEVPSQVAITSDNVPVVVSVQRKGTTYTYTDKNLPTGITADDLQKTVHRQIIEHLTSAGQEHDKYINQDANFVRTVTVYPATADQPQKVVFGDWTPKTDADSIFSEKAIDQVDGYISVYVDSDGVTGHPITVVPSQVVAKSNGVPIDADTFHVYYRKVSTVPEGNIPDGTTKKDGTKLTDADLGTDIIRDIYETAPGTTEPKLIKEQRVRLTRDALVNQFTHEVIGYSDWRVNSEYNKAHTADGYDDTLPDYTPTAYAGYTPSVAQVTPIIQIDNNTPHLIKVYISYNNQKRTQVINYVDSATGKTVRSQTITGVSGQDSSENLEIPAGYEQDTAKPAENVTFSQDGQSIVAHFQDKDLPTGTIYVKASQDTYTQDNVPANLRDQVVKEVTRTITVNRPGDKTPQVIKQTVIFHRTIKFDKVTGQVIPDTATAWLTDDNNASGTWEEYDAPTITGYVPTTATVASQTVTAETPNSDITINYTDNTQNLKLKAVDDANNESEITIPSGLTTEIKGTSSTPVDQDKLQGAIDKIVKALEDQGYKFAGNNTIDTYDDDSKTDQWITIHFTHQTEDDDQGQLPEGVTPEDLTKTITRTIHVQGEPTKSSHDETQTITATRKAIYDKVAKKITGYTDWTGSIPVFNVNQYTGYTSQVDGKDAKEVASVTIDNNTPSTLESTVTYKAGEATQTINYVTEDGTKVGTTSMSGNVGTVLGSGVVDKINGNVPSGYELVPGQNFTSYENNKFTTDDNPINVYVKVTGNTISHDGTKPDGVTDDQWNGRNKTVTRTIKFFNADGTEDTTKTITQTINLGADVLYDNVNKKFLGYTNWRIISGSWNSEDLTEKTPAGMDATIDGHITTYVPSGAVDVNNPQNQEVDVHFKAKDGLSFTVQYQTDSGVILKSYTIKGKANQQGVALAEGTTTIPDGYSVEAKSQAAYDALKSGNHNFGTSDETVVIYVQSAGTHNVGPDDPSKLPSGVTVSDLKKTVTRTATIHKTDGTTEDLTAQTVDFTRQAIVDDATGAFKGFTAWTPENGTWADETSQVPDVAGYTTVNKNKLGQVTVTGDMEDQHVDVFYVDSTQKAKIEAYTTDGTQLTIPSSYTTEISGKSGSGIAGKTINDIISYFKGEGYSFDHQDVDTYDTDSNVEQTVKLYFTKGEKNYDSNTPDSDLPKNVNIPGETSPRDLTHDDLYKTVTRTITTETPDGKSSSFTQTVVATRTATVDQTTKNVTFSSWNYSNDGQFASYDVPQLTGYTSTVNGTAATTVASASAKDGNGNPINGDAVTIKYTGNTTTLNPDDKGDVTIPDGTKKGDGTTGLEKKDLYVTSTRTINVYNTDGSAIDHTETQSVTYKRTATLDANKKVIGYSDWELVGKDKTWAAYTISVPQGYTSDSGSQIAEFTPGPGTQDVTINVKFVPETKQVEITYTYTNPKTEEKTVVDTDHAPITTGKETTITPQPPTGYDVDPSAQIPKTVTTKDGSTKTDDKGQTSPIDTPINIPVVQHVDTYSEGNVPEGTKKSDGTPITNSDLAADVTRTITINIPGQDAKTIKQGPVHMTRTVSINRATGEVTFGNWSANGSFDTYSDVPTIDGYTASQTSVATVTPDDPTKNYDVVINYTPNTANITYSAVDRENGTDSPLDVSDLDVTVDNSKGRSEADIKKDTDSVISAIKGKFLAQGYKYVTIEGTKLVFTKDTESKSTIPSGTTDTTGKEVTDKDLTQSFTRTINVKGVDGNVTTYKQTVTGHRQAIIDKTSGKVTGYTDWVYDNNDTYDQFGISQVKGYTSYVGTNSDYSDGSQKTFVEEVTNVNSDATVYVHYEKDQNDANAQIIFKDVDSGNQVGTTQEVTGPSGESKEFDLTAPAGYDFVDSSDAKKNITFSSDGKTIIVPVYVKHHTDTIGPKDTPDEATKKLITQSLTGNATRTITVHKVDGTTTTETQTVAMHRSAIIDRASGTVTYTAWEADDPQNASFAEYAPDKVAGYTTLVDGAPKDTVASETPTSPVNETVNVTYKASQKSAEIRYVDSKTQQVIKTDVVTGIPGQKVTNISTSVPTGYVLDDGQNVPTEIDIAAGDQATDPTIVYVHQETQTLTDEDAKKQGVLDSDLHRTVTRTVIINEPGKDSKTYTQVAHFNRQAILNKATGAITYTAWTSEDSHFDAISIPTVAGYKSTVAADDASVAAKDVTAEDRDSFVVVNYIAGDQDLTIRLHDVTDSSKSVDIAIPAGVTSVFHGKSGAPIYSADLRTAISKIKDELAKQGYQYVGEDMPIDYDTDSSVMQYLDMNFKRISDTIGPNDPVPSDIKKDDGSNLSHDDLTKTVTRTIYATDPQGNTTHFTQTVVVTRTATIDMNTKKVTGFSAWSSASFDEYSVPQYKDYTAHVDVDSDESGNVAGRAVTSAEIAAGHAADVHITYTSNTQDATPTKIPEGATKSDGTPLTKDDLEKTVTRTIHFVDENGNKVADDSVQSVTFSRTAKLDKNGKVISYSDWTQSGNWDDVTSPEKAGFKATVATIPAVALTPETAHDVDITVTYKPDRVIGHIKFVDDKTGALVSDKIVDAKAGQNGVATNASVPEGYEIAADSAVKSVPETMDFGATDHADVIIKVSQKVDDIDPDHIPDGAKKSDGTPLTKDDLEKTITRHIHFEYPASYKGTKDADFDQTVTIKRTAQYNQATKTVIFGDWNTATLENYKPADREGLVTPGEVPALTVDENSQDSTVTLTYTTKTASMNFKAHDDTTGKDINLPSTLQTSISHAGDTTVTQTEIDNVVNGIKAAVGDKYNFINTTTDEDGTVIVHFTHKTSPITATDTDEATTKEITRTIKVITPDGKTTETKQTVTYSRTVTTDNVTGQSTTGSWTTTDKWNSYAVPTIDGYTPSQNNIEEKIPSIDDKDEIITITYVKDAIPKPSDNKKDGNNSNSSSDSIPNKPSESKNATPIDKKSYSKSSSSRYQAAKLRNANRLPQTGNNNEAATAAGLAAVTVSGLMSLLATKKKKRH